MDFENLNSSSCLQCGKCSSGCPVAFESEHSPRKLMRFLQWGLIDESYKSPFLWLCTSCYTCFVRCPKKINIPEIIYMLRNESIKKQLVSKEIFNYYKSFTKLVNIQGRMSEIRLIFSIALKKIPKDNLFQNFILLIKLLLRGKLK